jgi:hypothetical protein
MQVLDLNNTGLFGGDKNACLARGPTGPRIDSIHVSMLVASALRQAEGGSFLLKNLRISRRFGDSGLPPVGQRVTLGQDYPDGCWILEARPDELVLSKYPPKETP